MKIKLRFNSLRIKITNAVQYLCGVEDGRINRTVFWSMLSTIVTITLLFLAFDQLHDVSETTSAEFAHKIKNDLYTPQNMRLISLFDNGALNFKSEANGDIWFALDTVRNKSFNCDDDCTKTPKKYSAFEIDELLQSFEDLSFYEKRGLLHIDYIYDAYAYYIEMLWQNPEIAKYIYWQRHQPHNSNSYINLEKIYKKLKAITDQEP